MLRKLVCVLLSATVIHVSLRADETINDLPSQYKASIEWVWQQRISPKSSTAPIGEGSTVRKNIIFDQIYFENGKLNYCGRWQSSQKLTLADRKKLEQTIQTKINNWTKHLVGYDGWPYKEIPVKIVSWAVADISVIVDKQSDEIVYTTCETDPVSKDDPKVPSKLPYAPSTCSRFDHFSETRYTYESCPGGIENRFDMYLWATSSWAGAVGGDWGQRMSESAWLSASMMIDHEMGHGFGITDFYQTNERPADMQNGTIKTIMWAGNASAITDWDKWMLRYMWTQLKKDTQRFPSRQVPVVLENSRSTPANHFSVHYSGNKLLLQTNTSNFVQVNNIQIITMAGKVISSRTGGLDKNGQLDYAVQLRQGLYFIKITNDCSNEFLKLNIH